MIESPGEESSLQLTGSMGANEERSLKGGLVVVDGNPAEIAVGRF